MIPAEDLESYVQEINTDEDLFYRTVDVQCSIGGCDFDKHKIAWVHPFIRYGTEDKEGTDKVFERIDDRMEFQTAIQPDFGFKYRTWYEVKFQQPDPTDNDTVYGDYDTFISQPRFRTDRELAINPMDNHELRVVEFSLANGFPLEEYPLITIDLKHEDAEGHSFTDTFVLPDETRGHSRTFKIRVKRGVEYQTQYRVTYHRAQGWLPPRDWETVQSSSVIIHNPLANIIPIGVRIAEMPSQLGWADIILRYQGSEGVAMDQEKRFFYSPDDLSNPEIMKQQWIIRTDDPNKQLYEFYFTFFYTDGTMLESPDWIESDARTLVVGRLAKPYRTITIKPTGPSFDHVELRDIKVTIIQDDPDNPEPHQMEVLIENEDETGEFTYRVKKPTHYGYSYEIRYVWRNGKVKIVTGTDLTGSLTLYLPTDVD